MALIFNFEEDEFYQKGLEKGLEKVKKSIIQVYKKGMKIHDIADAFDVSIEYVKEIIKNIN